MNWKQIINEILIYSILFPAILGCVRFMKLDTTYLPFILLIWLGLINETTGVIVMHYGYYNTVNFNIYTFLESCLVIWQFERWQFFRNKKTIRYLVAALFCIWLVENIYWSFYNAINSYYMITASYVVVLLCISMINKIVIKIQGPLFKNPTFLICLSWLIYFAYVVLSESFMVYSLTRSFELASRFQEIILYVNCFTNLAFGYAILWIPTKPVFILPS